MADPWESGSRVGRIVEHGSVSVFGVEIHILDFIGPCDKGHAKGWTEGNVISEQKFNIH